MPIDARQLEASVARGLSPLYLFGGPEPLIVQECRDLVFASAAQQGFTERELFHVERGFDWNSLGASGAAPSLFAERKIVDLRMPGGKPGREGASALVEWTENLDPDCLLVISCDTWDQSSRKSKWASKIDQAGTRVDIWPIKPNELPSWISGRMKQAGLEPEREAVMVLADRLEGNLLAAKQEIEKLVLLKGGGPVSADDVLKSVADSSRFDAFLLADRILAGNLSDGLRVALGLRRTGIAIQLVAGALVRELRMVESFRMAMSAGEQEAVVFRKLRIWRNRQDNVRKAARRLNGTRLGQAFADLALMDRQSKGRANGDPWHQLDRLVVDLCA